MPERQLTVETRARIALHSAHTPELHNPRGKPLRLSLGEARFQHHQTAGEVLPQVCEIAHVKKACKALGKLRASYRRLNLSPKHHFVSLLAI